MSATDTAPCSRPFAFRLGFVVPLALMALLLAFDPAPIDFALARSFYEPGSGFVGRNNYWLEVILHDRAKQAVVLFAGLLVVAFLASLWLTRLRRWRRPLAYLVLSLVLASGVVTPLKRLTAVHCPWSLTEFGGDEQFSALLEPRAPTRNPGLCWPGGHAATGFSLLSLFFVLRDRRPRGARLALVLALVLGSAFSLGRMAQGAHFLSHNVWTLLIDWLVCLTGYRWLLYRAPEGPAAADEAPYAMQSAWRSPCAALLNRKSYSRRQPS